MVLPALGTPAPGQLLDPGISHELASQRRNLISDVRYELEFWLEEDAETVKGEVIAYFTLPEGYLPHTPVVLDFAGAALTEFRVNGVPSEPARTNNHIVVPSDRLDPGRNRVGAIFRTRAAPTGAPLTVFRDEALQEEFVYTLLVPADAHRLFPCFDQPDLKAILSVILNIPRKWVAVANGAEKIPPQVTPEGAKRYEFVDTKPLSTYLMAFAAGPFEIVEAGANRENRTRIFLRGSKLGDADQAGLFTPHQRSLRWLEDYFGQSYAFGKLDLVLIPGFPYGGMEHAGAIFYRESAMVFDHVPTESELIRRSTLIYHEVCHQWFGNLVTMEWFDDLWLKEGFATFLGYHVLDALEPDREAWLRFHQSVKPHAYRIDATSGTTPVYQELGNLADAKSAYGAIVYNKAPAVLRELHWRLGPQSFREGVRLFLADHRFSNARWEDLVTSLQRASGKSLSAWSDAWILTAGMPRIRVEWDTDEQKRVSRFEVHQQGVQDRGASWPLSIEILLIRAGGQVETIGVETRTAHTSVPEVIGTEAPVCVLPNPGDQAYGQFLLDPVSQGYWLSNASAESDPLRRAVALTALFDTVREADLAPARLAELLIELLEQERDPLTHRWLLDTLSTTLRRYLHPEEQSLLCERAVEMLLTQLRAGLPGLELQTFRFLALSGSGPEVLGLCEALLRGPDAVPGLELGVQDRYLALAALHAAGRAESWLPRMTGAATPVGAEKHSFLALAAAADGATKGRYFDTYLHPDEPPEQWMQESLAFFHWPGQGHLTLPYLRRALEQVQWVKENRKIFFMPAWIDSFVNAHSGRDALDIAEAFLAERDDLTADIRLKILQSLDGLQRAVAIKDKWK